MKFWQELLRRKVLRTAGLYVVGAWLVLQVADVLFPAWGLPDMGIRYLFLAGVAGFPIAVVFGWFYDITPQGIVRTDLSPGAEATDHELKRTDYVILFALLAVGVAILYGSFGKIRETVEESPGSPARLERVPNSIAVLPFRNLDPNPDTGYFSDGVSEAIQNRLSSMKRLRVRGLTSSFAFRNSNRSPDEISQQLGVLFLLRGSVGREKNFVRIQAELIDESGFVRWSDTFDRKMDSIFAIQSEVAHAVTEQIIEEIIPRQEMPAGRTTENMEAYNAYLQGRAFFNDRTSGWQQRAESAFHRAIELDPGYAPPHAGLATLVVNSPRGPHWESARDSAAHSLELDPDLPLGHATLGLTLAVLGDSERGLESLLRAVELDPNLAIAYSWMTMPLQDLGRPDEAQAMLRKGLDIDPYNSTLLRNISGHESNHGNFLLAEQLLARLTTLPEPPARSWAWLNLLYDQWGRYPEAVDAARNSIRLELENGVAPDFEPLIYAYAKLGMTEEADYWYGLLRAHSPQDEIPIHVTAFLAPLGHTRWLFADLQQVEKQIAVDKSQGNPFLLSYGGLAWIQAGDNAKGIEWLERGIAIYQQMMAPGAPNGVDYGLLDHNWGSFYAGLVAKQLGFAYLAEGRQQDADRALQFLQEQLQITQSWVNPAASESRALTHLLSGDEAGASEHLRSAVDLGWANFNRVVNDKAWTSANQVPGITGILTETRATLAEQRARVEATDEANNFRAEVEALLSK